jgi:very-short-patch-repair endonuclease
MDRGSVGADNGGCTETSEYVTMMNAQRSAMPPLTAEAAGFSVARWLDRHEQRRRSGLPTVSVISGPLELSCRIVEHWAHGRGRSLAWFQGSCPRPEDLACAWVERAVSHQVLADAAIPWLAQRIDGAADKLAQSLRVMTPMELVMLLDRVLPLPSATGVETACKWLLEQSTGEDPRDPNGEAIARGLNSALGDHARPWMRVLVALGELLDPEAQPVLVLSPPKVSDEPAATVWIEQAASLLADLAIAQPRLPLCLLVEPGMLQNYFEKAAESRAKAVLRESVVTIAREQPEPSGGRRRMNLGNANSGPEKARSRLVRRGTSARLLSLFDEAVSAASELRPESCEPADVDRARSAAERFLYEQLESLHETAGLFRLNQSLGFRFGPDRAIEVDLSATSLNLAIEIDGYYHFQNSDSYRRDRRKDIELQKHGYLVVRVLAEDVVCRLEEVLETIVAAARFRRAGRVGTVPRNQE